MPAPSRPVVLPAFVVVVASTFAGGCASTPADVAQTGTAPAVASPSSESAADTSEETLFVRIGGEDRIRALSDAFHDHMDRDPQFASLRAMHSDDLTEGRVKLADFMCGWFGGPNYYLRKHGAPRMPSRHAPFPIAEADRDEWLACMALALDDLEIEGELRAELDDLFFRGADFLRNREG